jgi:hypothetical protein
MKIQEILSRRSDLSTFIVHLTKEPDSALKLRGILESGNIEARNMFGHAKRRIEDRGIIINSQKCVCFTETPLEYLHLLTKKIDNRQVQLGPYGIAFPKKIARRRGINPIWYVDQTPGHDWITRSLDNLIEIDKDGLFTNPEIEKIMPFIEQMGTWNNSSKEFWWEREWRHIGNFTLPDHFIGLCPEDKIEEFEGENDGIPFIDPDWGMEEIIGHLAGFNLNTEIRVL